MHANIKNFKSAIDKKEINKPKIDAFEAWMNNPKKFPEEEREDAQKLLDEAKKLLASGRGNEGLIAARQQSQQNTRTQGRSSGYYSNNRGYHNSGKNGNQPVSNAAAQDPSILGNPFHNPYTFISFPSEKPERHAPTPLTIDELETERKTGFVDLEIETLSPLLVPEHNDKKDQTVVSAMRIGKNVIVPASSIRGTLRNLTAIISGSALDYVDDNLWLCQGRDAKLDDKFTQYRYLAEVIVPGDSSKDGIVRFAKAELVESKKLKIFDDRQRKDYSEGKLEMWIDDPAADYVSISRKQDPSHPWRVKLSEKKVGDRNRNYHDGAFRPEEAREITLRANLWKDYLGRHRNANHKELRKGDLVWLEPNVFNGQIHDGGDVKSIQWARWGRTGVNFKENLQRILGHMLPDSIKNDGKVDITSDLFGSIPIPEDGEEASYEAFAARIRPENLIFENPETFWNEMPPLSSPHPGCKAFYVENQDLDDISLLDPPRGYKVYRTSKHTSANEAPWKYLTQPVFVSPNAPKPFSEMKNNAKKCELLQQNAAGKLRISFRALNEKELALLLLVLSCDLRIGGGKPLGLGHCIVKNIRVYDEDLQKLYDYQPDKHSVPNDLSVHVQKYFNRAKCYCKTQEPVEMMRYPRAINGNQRGGMCWFSKLAVAKKDSQKGLQVFRWEGKEIKAQVLPVFDPSNPESDQLFGYDLTIGTTKNKGDNLSRNREDRKNDRYRR